MNPRGSRPNTRRHAYSSSVKEASFQSRVVACAILNGWRIDYEDTLESIHPEIASFLSRFFKKLEKPREFLRSRRGGGFALAYHTHDSRRSAPGFPDLVLVHPRKQRILLAELKRDGEYPKTEQRLWLTGLSCVEAAAPHVVSVRLWRPRDWESIVKELGGESPRLFV